jgi:hypothetical protein
MTWPTRISRRRTSLPVHLTSIVPSVTPGTAWPVPRCRTSGRRPGAGAHGRRDLHGGAAHASRSGGDEHGFAGLQPPPVDQALIGGPGADYQPGCFLEA